MESKKTIVIINQTAGSPYHGMVYRNYYLAREWARLGHRAIIISSTSFHNFHTKPKTEGLFTKEIIDGIEYWWVKLPEYSQSKSIGRLVNIFLFPLVLLFFPFSKIPDPDAVILSGPPPVAILNAWFFAKKRAAKLIYEVRDIWPLTIQKLGSVSEWHPFILILRFFEKCCYLLADNVVSVLRFAYKHFEAKGMTPGKFAYIPNGIDISDYSLHENETGRKIAEISSKAFTVIYAGSFGIANHLDQLINVANKLKDQNIAFVLVGDGPKKKELMEMARNHHNIHFFPYVPKEQIPFILKQAQVAFIGFVKTDLYKFGVSPNKIFDYMAAERPILMVLDSDDDIVSFAKAGYSVKSNDIESIANGVLKLKSLSSAELSQLGKNGRAYLEQNHTYKKLATKYLELIG